MAQNFQPGSGIGDDCSTGAATEEEEDNIDFVDLCE
jgi:hypothetical protein